ncbi:EpsG family protein [Limosilactobacillus reuteri]|nr:EpsG family protein [Limosilactobacillus reuteri]
MRGNSVVYIFVFLLSSLFVLISEFFYRNRILSFYILFLIFAIFTLAFFAAVRNINIGTDTIMYSNYFHAVTNYSGILSYCSDLRHAYGIEYGFLILNYFVGIFTNNVHIFFFVCQCLILTNIYLSLNNVRNNVNVCVGWLTYCFLFYPVSLNILRQSISISFILLGISYIYKGSYKRTVLLFLIAVLFHTSAIFSLIIFVYLYIINKIHKKSEIWMVFISILIITALIPITINFLNSRGLIGDKYSQYLIQSNTVSLFSTIGVRTPMIVLMIASIVFSRKYLRKNDYFIYILIIQEFTLLPLQQIATAVGRILLCFGIVKVIGYPLILQKLTLQKSILKVVFLVAYVILIVFIFYNQVIINNSGEIYPYVVSSDI